MKKTALITGISGQDGSYLAAFLLNKGYIVHGITREKSNPIPSHKYLGITDRIRLHQVNLIDITAVKSTVKEIAPTEIYHLAAQSSVNASLVNPGKTIEFNVNSTANLLETIRTDPSPIKFFYASSSEIFDPHATLPLTINSSIKPTNPYGMSKAQSHFLVQNYRKEYSLYLVNGILFPHESPLRAPHSFIKTTIRQAVAISQGSTTPIRLGQIENKRDFGDARDYAVAMWWCLQQSAARDYIIATGKATSIKQITEYILTSLNVPLNVYFSDPALWREPNMPIIYGDNSDILPYSKWSQGYDLYTTIDDMIRFEKDQSI